MTNTIVIGGGFGGSWYAKATGARLLTRSNGYDLNVDLDRIMAEIAHEKARVVVNFASQSMVAQSWATPWDWMQTNVRALSAFIAALGRYPYLERYVHFTTPEVYGSTNGWQKESWNFAPASPYAASRACGDWMVKLWHQRFDFPAIFTRAANIYGEGQQLYRIIPKALLHKLEGRVFPLNEGRKQRRAFVHMDDVTAALNLLMERGAPGEVYHISPREEVTIGQVVDMCGCPTRLLPETPSHDRRDEAYLLDSAKIMAMGWTPKVSLKDGIARTRIWMETHRDEWVSWAREYEHRV